MTRPLSLMLSVLWLTGCTPPKPPVIVPTPPPEEQPTFPELLTRRDGPTFTDTAGNHIRITGAILCCGELAQPYGWPSITPAGVDLVADAGATLIHMRLGPFIGGTGYGQEPAWAVIGGAYATDPATGKADLNTWNEAFWAAQWAAVRRAGERGVRVQVSLIDGWGCGHAKAGDYAHPWLAGSNIQGQGAIASCGSQYAPIHQAFVRKAVEELGVFSNVIWEDGNEIGRSHTAYQSAWSLAMRSHVRQIETELGYPIKMFGTNSDDSTTAAGAVDYVSVHTGGEYADVPAYGKPTLVSEYNPNPPLTPEVMQSWGCAARKAGTYYAAWAHGMTGSEFLRAVRLLAGSCEGVDTSGCPMPVPPTAELGCKAAGVHGTCPDTPGGQCRLWDCTPKRAGGAPIWPEGNATVRMACEMKSMGGLPTFAFPAGSTLRMDHEAHNGFAFAVGGRGADVIRCSIPRQGAGWRGCVDGSRQPLVVRIP